MRSTLLHIITNPKVYATLQSEIDEAVRTNRISNPISDSEARELPYLTACIREGLRIWPPVPSTFSKTVPPDGDTLAGTFVPGGTNIGISMLGVQRNKSVFGKDVDMFRPERWLEASGEQLQRMEKTNDLVFGSGRYQCLGKNIAMIELRKVFVEVRRRGPQQVAFWRPLADWRLHCSSFAASTSRWYIPRNHGSLKI
jgi:cytochrome P450